MAKTIEAKNAASPKLELFGGDTIGYCDAETGVCAVPDPISAPNAIGKRQKPTPDERASDRGKAPSD